MTELLPGRQANRPRQHQLVFVDLWFFWASSFLLPGSQLHFQPAGRRSPPPCRLSSDPLSRVETAPAPICWISVCIASTRAASEDDAEIRSITHGLHHQIARVFSRQRQQCFLLALGGGFQILREVRSYTVCCR